MTGRLYRGPSRQVTVKVDAERLRADLTAAVVTLSKQGIEQKVVIDLALRMLGGIERYVRVNQAENGER